MGGLQHGSEIIRRAGWGGGCVGLSAYRSGPEAGPEQVGQLLAGVGEGVAAGPLWELIGEERGRRCD